MGNYAGICLIDEAAIDKIHYPMDLAVYTILARHRQSGNRFPRDFIQLVYDAFGCVTRDEIIDSLNSLVADNLIEVTDDGVFFSGVRNDLSYDQTTGIADAVLESATPTKIEMLAAPRLSQKPAIRTRERKIKKLIARDGEGCRAPGCEQVASLTIDHIVPRKFGGSNDLSNLQLLCKSHNSEKRDRSWEWFVARRQQVQS